MDFLKLIMKIGGVYEILMGLAMFFFIRFCFGLLGDSVEIQVMMFPRSAGVLAITFGLLMLAAARDPGRYIIVPLVSIILRLMIQLPILGGCPEMPGMTLPLIAFGAIDMVLAVLTAVGIRKAGIEWREW